MKTLPVLCASSVGGYVRAFLRVLAAAIGLCAMPATGVEIRDAAHLRALHRELVPKFSQVAPGPALHIVSHETRERLEGDAYAELPLGFVRIGEVLGSAETLCNVLFLQQNVRGCHASPGPEGPRLTLIFGPKQLGLSVPTHSMSYTMQVLANTTDYLRVLLTAAHGPLATRNYRIALDAIPVADERTFIHFGYGFTPSTWSTVAMKLYLSTAGRAKIGFTVTGVGPDGKPVYVQGERGSLERNLVRNFLAVQAYASVAGGDAEQQMQERLRTWYALTEQYPEQLHELSLDEYLKEKSSDLKRAR